MEEKNKYFLAFDTETGSTSPEDGDLLTAYFAIVNYYDLSVIEELELKLKPDDNRSILAEEGALKVNKINLEQHLNDPSTVDYKTGKEKLVNLIKKYLKKSGRYSNIIPFAYNIQFDIGYVQYHLLPKKEWENLLHYAVLDPKQALDFLKYCQWFPDNLGNLGSLVDYFQIPKLDAHTAKDDVLMTLDVFKKMTQMMKDRNSTSSLQGSSDLLEIIE